MAQAVNDAKETAKINNIHNCDFIEGKVEMVNIQVSPLLTNQSDSLIFLLKVLKQVLDELSMTSDLCAVLNPGRAGVRKLA